MILFGYVRLTKAGRSEAEQEAAMRAGGLDDFSAYGPVYVEALPKRRAKEGEPAQPKLDEMVRSLRPGSVVVLAGLDVLASTREGLRQLLGEIGAAGGVVRLMDTGETLSCAPEALAAAEAIERAVKLLHTQRASNARGSKGDHNKGGRKLRATPEALAKARPVYFDVSLTNDEVEKRTGISYRTLHRHLGKRGSAPIGERRAAARKDKA
jgi:DNA invertase Pin-like site-specific DNA recombinase